MKIRFELRQIRHQINVTERYMKKHIQSVESGV